MSEDNLKVRLGRSGNLIREYYEDDYENLKEENTTLLAENERKDARIARLIRAINNDAGLGYEKWLIHLDVVVNETEQQSLAEILAEIQADAVTEAMNYMFIDDPEWADHPWTTRACRSKLSHYAQQLRNQLNDQKENV